MFRSTVILLLLPLIQAGWRLSSSGQLLSQLSLKTALNSAMVAAMLSCNFIEVSHVQAVSGGGKDYGSYYYISKFLCSYIYAIYAATKDVRGQNFDSQNLADKDFTQCGTWYIACIELYS
jgi:hypothetical protein